MHILKNSAGSLCAGDGFLCLTEALTEQSFYFFGRDEFTVQIERDGVAAVYPSSALRLCGVTETDGAFMMDYKGDGFEARLEYRDGGDCFSKTVTVKQSRPGKVLRICLENRELSAAPFRGGEGQPVFAVSGGACLWAGTEFPACYNGVIKNNVDFTQAPFEETETVGSLPVVYGVAPGDPSTAFYAYVKRRAIKNEPLRVYCDWSLHCEGAPGAPELTEKLTLDNIKELCAFEKKAGIRFDYYLMDAYWFETGVPYTAFKKRTFPDGAGRVVEALKQAGMKFGLWFDINCINAALPDVDDLRSGVGAALCLGCRRTAELFYEGVAKQIDDCDIDMIKLDFAYFECPNPAHGHSTHPHEYKERSVRYFLDAISRLKKKKPGLKVLAYNGFTTSLEWICAVKPLSGFAVSPYWSSLLDYVYCGDPRPSDSAFCGFSDSVAHYSDCMTANHVDSCFPLTNTDDHGTMVGVTDTIYGQGRSTFRRALLSNMMRGTMKLHFYGDVRLLDDGDAEYFGYIDRLFEDISRNFGFRLAGGDPRLDQPYGYEAFRPGEGYFMLCAPCDRPADVTVKLPGPCRIDTLIDNGRIVNETGEAYGTYTAHLDEAGYVLLHYRVEPCDRGYICTPLCPGDEASFPTEGFDNVRLNFTLDGKPYRVPDALPPDVTATIDGEPAVSLPAGVWSGKSWLYIETKGKKELRVKNGGDVTYELRLRRIK